MRKLKLFTIISAMLVLPLIAMATGEAKVLKIGVTAATTGRAAGWGLAVVWGVKQAVEELNEAGGVKVGGEIYTVKLFQYDDKYTTSGGKAAGEYLIDEENVSMVCSLGTAPTITLQEISEAKKVILFHGCTAHKALVAPDKKYTFTHAYGASEMSVVMFPYLMDKYDVKTIAFLLADTKSGTGYAADAKIFAEKAGLKLVGYERLNLQLTDFYPVLSKLIKNKPDAIQYCQLPLGVDGLVTKQLYEVGYRGVKSHSSGREGPKFVRISGKKAAENTLLWSLFDFSAPDVPAKTKAFRDRYFAEHKQEPTSLSMRNYSAVMIYAEAIKRAGTLDPDKVVEIIKKMGKEGLDTLYGKAKLTGSDWYGIDHRIGLPLPLTVVGKNGELSFKGSITPGM